MYILVKILSINKEFFKKVMVIWKESPFCVEAPVEM